MNLVARKKTAACGMGELFFGERACYCKKPRAVAGPSGGLEGYSLWPNGTPRIGMGDFGDDPSAYESLGPAPVTDLSGEVGDSGLTNADLIALNGSIQAGPDYESAVVAPNGVGITSSGQPLTGVATVNSTGSLVGMVGSTISALLAPSPQQAGLAPAPAASANPTATQILPWVLLGGGALILISAFRK